MMEYPYVGFAFQVIIPRELFYPLYTFWSVPFACKLNWIAKKMDIISVLTFYRKPDPFLQYINWLLRQFKTIKGVSPQNDKRKGIAIDAEK